MNEKLNAKLVKDFLESFEEVFDKDWIYTKEMLGIYDQTAEQKKASADFGLEEIPIIAENGTFIHPDADIDIVNWGNRVKLLATYQSLKKAFS